MGQRTSEWKENSHHANNAEPRSHGQGLIKIEVGRGKCLGSGQDDVEVQDLGKPSSIKVSLEQFSSTAYSAALFKLYELQVEKV
jgi:hypothetical protein